jgi:hypothetical protein
MMGHPRAWKQWEHEGISEKIGSKAIVSLALI